VQLLMMGREKPETAAAVDRLLMMVIRMPKTC
jgi:hypothetical protein